MKGKVRLKTIIFFLVVVGVQCGDFIDDIKSSLNKLQETVHKISFEQIKTNKKVDQLEEKISDAIDQLKHEIKTFTLENCSGNGNNESKTTVAIIANGSGDRTNLTEDHIDAFNHVVNEGEEKGENIFFLSTYDFTEMGCCSYSCGW